MQGLLEHFTQDCVPTASEYPGEETPHLSGQLVPVLSHPSKGAGAEPGSSSDVEHGFVGSVPRCVSFTRAELPQHPEHKPKMERLNCLAPHKQHPAQQGWILKIVLLKNTLLCSTSYLKSRGCFFTCSQQMH